MKKSKTYKILCLTLGLGIALSGSVVQAASLTKTLKAAYSNIGISYNGQMKYLTSEPFLVDGATYVPLRAVSEIMGSNVNWANNTVYITGSTAAPVSSDQELAAKNFEIASLKQQLEVAKKELETFKGTGTTAGSNLTTAAVSSTLSTIESEYEDEYSVDWEFNLKIVSSRLELTVSYDSRYDESPYNKLSESKRKALIKDICYDISDRHNDVEIRGTIEDSRTDTEKASFKYTKSGSYQYDEETALSLGDLEDDLERYYKTIDCIGFSIPINYIELSERSGTLTFTIRTNLRYDGNDFREKWNNTAPSYKRDLEDFLGEIKEDIEDDYSTYDEIIGIIKDDYTGNTIASFENNERAYFETVSTY
ncbi:MAG: copper amine oxidase N-terminal protein [Clostridia bacterium]|nr:copper amine oxidase N-terminal protein [Clostridia bacterium]